MVTTVRQTEATPALSPEPLAVGTLSPGQLRAVQVALATFVTDDLARGISPATRIYCDACERARSAVGAIPYARYLFCNECAVEYEAAHLGGLLTSPGQYVRDKRFGDGARYALAD